MIHQRFSLLLTGLCCLALLSGCNEDAVIQKAIPKEADAFARNFISAIEKKDHDAAAKLIDSKVRAEASPKLKSMGQLFEGETLVSIKPIGVRGGHSQDQRLIQISYEITFSKKWLIATVVVLETAQNRSIVSARIDPIPQPLEKLYDFKLLGKSFLQYVVLMFWFLIPCFICYTLWGCIGSNLKWKWVWIPFIILGLTTLHLDWFSGRAFFRPLGFLIFGVWAMKSKYGPWVLSVSLPLGALVFYFLYLFKPKKTVTMV